MYFNLCMIRRIVGGGGLFFKENEVLCCKKNLEI